MQLLTFNFLSILGSHIAATAGYTVFNASQMYKYRQTNDLRQPYQQQEGQINMRQETNHGWKQKSDIQGQPGDQLLNNDVLSDKQNMKSEQLQGRYLQDKNDREVIDLRQKLKEGNKGMEYKENEPVEKLQQNNGKAFGKVQSPS